tara:strand:+ start:148 stop:552 length:405 start_codon:yes stop_codon:yes gene_type:complete
MVHVQASRMPDALTAPAEAARTPAMTPSDAVFDCQACGACCAYSADWPRFSIESDAALDLIPAALVASDLSGMRCENDRCAALSGVVGTGTGCTIYALRPQVCRECVPGGEDCRMARQRFGLDCDMLPATGEAV